MMTKLIGPFKQLLTLANMPWKGALQDDMLDIKVNAGVLVSGDKILEVDAFEILLGKYPEVLVELVEQPMVLLPGFIDCHTHLCFAGSRANDYALRIAGKTYLEIAASGGGIWDSVRHTREATSLQLADMLVERASRHLSEGVTTIEVKSGYGLTPDEEIKQLEAVQIAAQRVHADLIPTCLAAHIKPHDYHGDHGSYLSDVVEDLLPELKRRGLANRVDIFVEKTAFSPQQAMSYLRAARIVGFQSTVHADQFTTGGTAVAVDTGAQSADHLEASGDAEIAMLAGSNTVAVALPGASLGLGMPYTPARKLLDAGACVAIASDWNPGSAPMGDLLMQAAILSAAEKLNTAETFAALTSRAARALGLADRGSVSSGLKADFQAYPCGDYREILYHQGKLKPSIVWKDGVKS